ncbi:MAG: hypothetical protein O9314_14930 [Microcystis sp. LE19-4.1E]|jgi:hypothetical protein|nr:hypothetical protein [Microcystis sp. LE19-4.1E]
MKRFPISLAASLMATTILAGTALAQQSAQPHDLLFVGAKDALVTYDLATGAEVARVPQSADTTDLAVTADGVVLANHRGGTTGNGIIAVDARTGQEIRRFPVSTLGGVRPVHAYLTPTIGGRQFFISVTDGNAAATARGAEATDSALTAIDVTPGSPTRLTVVGEVRKGNGHSKLAFSPASGRFSASNISDCDEVLGIYQINGQGQMTRVAAIDATQLGLDGSSREKTCDATGREGVRLSPHGATTAPVNGRHFHNLNGTGQFVWVDADLAEPRVGVISTRGGSGGANMTAHLLGRVVYGAQFAPREGGQGARAGSACQIGQIAVLDPVAGAVAAQVPVKLDGPDCARSLAGTDEALVRPAFSAMSGDGRTLFVTLGTMGGASPQQTSEARSRKLVMFDVSDPANPRQLPSLEVGAANGHRDYAITGDGRYLLVPSNRDHSVAVVDMVERRVARTIKVADEPNRVASFGSAGPSKPHGPVPPVRTN